MAVLYSNNASSTLSASITSTATSLSVASGKGALFPAPTGGDYFYVTLVNTAGAIEIMKVTARSTDTFTVVRGQDGTTAVGWAAGDRVELRFTKAMLDDIKSERMPASGPSVGSNGRILVNLSGNPAWSDATFTYDLATAQFRAGNFRANVGDTAPTWNFNNILHAGNYTSYSPSLTGTGASGTWGISITGYGYGLNVLDTDRTIANRLPTSTGQSVRFDFANSNAVGTGGNYAGVMTFSPWTGTTSSTGDASYQLVFGSTATNGSGLPRLRLRNGIDSTWNAWYDIYTSASYVAQNQWTPIATGGVTRLNSTTWSKSGGTNNVWDAQIYSAEALPSNVYAQAQFSSTAGRVMFGLSTVVGTANDTSADYAVIHYAFYGNLGDLRIYESGSDIGSFGAYTASSVLTVTYDGANVRYYKDGALLRTVARATGNGLYFDSSFYNTSNSSQLSNIEFGRMSQHALWKSGGTITGSAWSNTLGGDFVIANSSTVGSSLTLRPTNSASYSSGWSVYAGASGAAIGDGAIGFWNHTDQAARFYVTQAGAGYLAGNSILTAGNYTSYAASAGHTHNYIPINPDGDGNAWTYSDENPTINGFYVGGGQRFGADGSSYEGFLQAKIVNAYNGFVNSGNGYYLGNYDFGANSSTYSTTLAIDSSNNHYGLSMRSGRFLTTYSATTYNWTGSAFQFYWTKVANIFNVGDAHMRIEITTKTDVNYVGYTIAVASVSTWNNSTHSIKLDALNSYDVPVKLAVDNSGNVWLYSEAVWSSYINWRFLDILGSPTIYTSSWAQQLTQPANSAVISPGQGVRGNQGSIASATVYTSSAHQMSALNTLGAITQNGNQVLHAGNYSSYGDGRYVQKTGDVMSGRLTISPGWTTSGRNYSNEWIEFGNYSGLYSPNNGAHFYPNNGSYGSWRSAGSRNGWAGIEFDASNGQMVLMFDAGGNTTGFHNNSYGWQFRWNNGTAYVYKNAYGGGTAATVLDSSNYTSYIGGGSYSGTTTITSATAGDTWNSTLTSTTLADKLTSRFTKTNTPPSGIQTNYIGGLAWNGKNYLGNSYEFATIVGSVLSASSLSSGAYALGQIELNAYFYSSSLALSAGLKIGNSAFIFSGSSGQYLSIQSGGIVPTTSGVMSLGNSTQSFGPAYFQSVRLNNGWYENSKLLQFSGSLAANYNAMMAGPVTLDTGYIITIETGATLTIV